MSALDAIMTILSLYFLYCTRSRSSVSVIASGHRMQISRIELMPTAMTGGLDFSETKLYEILRTTDSSVSGGTSSCAACAMYLHARARVAKVRQARRRHVCTDRGR